MKQRCDVPTNQSYARYGGRGITYSPDWSEYIPFRDWALANGYIQGLLLDREDNDGSYYPNNCRWVTSAISGENKMNVKLNPDSVRMIRDLSAAGARNRVLGALFGVGQSVISSIKCGHKWSHIA